MNRTSCKVIALIFSALTAACATQGTVRGSAVEARRPQTSEFGAKPRRDILPERSSASPEAVRRRRQKEPFTITVDPSVEVEFTMEDNEATLVGNSLRLARSGETLHLDGEINGVITLRVFIDAPVLKGVRVLRVTSENSDGSTDIALINGGVVVELTSNSQK